MKVPRQLLGHTGVIRKRTPYDPLFPNIPDPGRGGGGLAGCGVVAAPVRGTSAVVKVVPVAGDVVAAPLDVTADVID